MAESVVSGADPEKPLEAIREYEHGDFTHVFVHQIGQDQEAFLRLYADEILPNL